MTITVLIILGLIIETVAAIGLVVLLRKRPYLFYRIRGFVESVKAKFTRKSAESSLMDELDEELSEDLEEIDTTAATLQARNEEIADLKERLSDLSYKHYIARSVLERISKLHRPVGQNAGIKLAREGLDEIK